MPPPIRKKSLIKKGVRRRMKVLAGLGLSMVWLLAACGGTSHVVTQKVYTDPNREVGLQTVSESSRGEGFSHPAFLKNTDIANVLKGLYVERQSSISLPLMGGGEFGALPLVFNQNEIAFFAPLLARVRLAQPNEVVTFYERGEISHLHEVRTSGGLYLQGDVLYVILSNHAPTKFGRTWKNTLTRRLRPSSNSSRNPAGWCLILSIHGHTAKRSFGTVATGKPWQVGVRSRNCGNKWNDTGALVHCTSSLLNCPGLDSPEKTTRDLCRIVDSTPRCDRASVGDRRVIFWTPAICCRSPADRQPPGDVAP